MGKPIYIKTEKLLHHSLDKVWKAVALGFGHVADYNPEIKASKFDSEKVKGVGTKRHCDTPDGGFLKEEIIEWEDRQYFKLKLVDTSFPMAVIESTFRFAPVGDQTRVTQEFWYRMKAPMGWLSGVMKGRMLKTLESGLNGLDYYLTHGEKSKG